MTSRFLALWTAIVLITCGAAVAIAQDPHSHSHAGQGAHATAPPGGMPDLIGGLKNTPGCYGVDATEHTMSGKSVIFAWFKDKAAVMQWYESDTHIKAAKMFFPGFGNADAREPMVNVPDDVPLMLIASITMADEARIKATSMPISQIAIEIYAQVDGGLFLGGRFAPDEFPVPPTMADHSLTSDDEGHEHDGHSHDGHSGHDHGGLLR